MYSILTSREAGFHSLAKLAGWLRMGVPLPFWQSLYPEGYPSFFVFIFVGSYFFFPLFSWPWGIAPRPLDRQNTKKNTGFPWSLTDGYAIMMSPSKGETAVYGCHCPRDMAVRMRDVMVRPWVGVCVPLA